MKEATARSAEAEPAAELPEVIYLPDQSLPKKPRRRRGFMEHFRTDDAEHTELVQRAANAGLSVNAYCRMRTLDGPGPRSRRSLPTIDEKLLARNNAELNMIGSNLNQAVRALNEIALNERPGGLAQVAHLTEPILAVLDALALTLDANRRALGHDREG